MFALMDQDIGSVLLYFSFSVTDPKGITNVELYFSLDCEASVCTLKFLVSADYGGAVSRWAFAFPVLAIVYNMPGIPVARSRPPSRPPSVCSNLHVNFSRPIRPSRF